MELQGKTALITGGTRGIGAAAAIDLARQGANVAINGRYVEESAENTKAEIEKLGQKCVIVTGDVAKPEDINRIVMKTTKELREIDILVHCAGGNVPGKLMTVEPDAWLNGFDVHVHAVYYLCREIVPGMQKKGEGAIILISSTAGLRGVPNMVAYCTAKGAVVQMARALARDLADDNIRVNCVSPGIVLTRFHAQMSEDARRHHLDNRIPLHRFGQPEDVAQVITMLAKNEYMTGENVVVDGGLIAQTPK